MASRPDGVPTADLLEAAWPEANYSTAQRRLSSTLTALRSVLRGAIGTPNAPVASHDQGRYRLTSTSHPGEAPTGSTHTGEDQLWVDYWAFRAAAATARAHTATPRITAQQQMAALYTGELLPELDTHWIEASRTDAQNETITALAQLSEHCQEHDPDRAVALLQVALEYDHTHRATAAQLIRLHQRRSQPDAAHRVYAQLAAHLTAAGLPGPDHTTTEALNTQPIPTHHPAGHDNSAA
jgi:DNA-binding SARP family transcriptional activator